MIIIWQGMGFLALVIPLLISLAAQLASDSLFEQGFYSGHPLFIGAALLASAAVVWWVGAKLNGKPGQILVDPKTGEQFEFKKKHTLFWIPMQWFSAAIAALALAVVFK
ncbi:MAG: hypothetical protein GAK35_02951 [Herbaspirillum frisingense]|uniref:Uncharacterized protein n=1 Tax=Herbaspirillum frisingense TaxID=92645 RepID=A0A7V8FVH4_9BURK|nr:MAG: hypothetical protein GAK35_02951 [Herbaspirillum frisingense]